MIISIVDSEDLVNSLQQHFHLTLHTIFGLIKFFSG